MSVTESLELDVFFEGFNNFYPNVKTTYTTVDGITEITNRRQKFGYIDVSGTNYIKMTDGTVILTGTYDNGSVSIADDTNPTGIKLLNGTPITFPVGLFTTTPSITCTSRRPFLPISVSLINASKDGFTPPTLHDII